VVEEEVELVEEGKTSFSLLLRNDEGNGEEIGSLKSNTFLPLLLKEGC